MYATTAQHTCLLKFLRFLTFVDWLSQHLARKNRAFKNLYTDFDRGFLWLLYHCLFQGTRTALMNVQRSARV